MPPVTRAKEQEQEQEQGKGEGKAEITLYWLDKSRSQRILWLLQELNVPYTLKTFKRQKDMLAPPELKEVHPLGKSPVITVSSEATNGKTINIAESSNIIEYLIAHFGQHLEPQRWQQGKDGEVGGETEGWLRYRYLMHYAEGSLMPLIVTALLFRSMKEASPFFIRPVTLMLTGMVESRYLEPNFRTHLDFLEDQLKTSPGEGKFFCGTELTGADIVMIFPLAAARGRAGLTEEKYPRLWAYVGMLEEREGYKKAVEEIVRVEGKYDSNL